jgi:CHAT domain/SIR2-like domain
MPEVFADLEINLRYSYKDGEGVDWYTVDMRFVAPDSEAETRPLPADKPVMVTFDFEHLRAPIIDDETYGKILTQGLFGHEEVRTAFEMTRASASGQEAVLRVRLSIDPSAQRLADLAWETLRDPRDPSVRLLTGERVLFSRFVSSRDARPVQVRSRGTLRSMVAIANPVSLSPYGVGGSPLQPIDVAGELERAKTSLEREGNTLVVLQPGPKRATLEGIFAELRATRCDVLYLVCHGELTREGPMLHLEREDGAVKLVSGLEFIARTRELLHPPRLIVLASCQSAGVDDDRSSQDLGAMVALGPGLAEAGVPAVIAMQGNITMKTVAQFMPAFFAALDRNGQIDQAVAIARGSVRERFDAWVPVLFMRLRSGRLWYETKFSAGPGDGVRIGLEALAEKIRGNECTPILGPGLFESMFGSRRRIAQDWVEQYHLPVALEERDSLSQAAQYLAVNQGDRDFPLTALQKHLTEWIWHTHRDRLSVALCAEYEARLAKDEPRRHLLGEMVRQVGAWQREQSATEPYKVLASLPFSIYITTNPGSTLLDALREQEKQPELEVCRWNSALDDQMSVFETDRDYRPSPQRPLVFHLFGHFSIPASIVLTEDDHFDYLIGVSKRPNAIPLDVRARMNKSLLIFLGFQVDDWGFRSLFRTIQNQDGQSLRNRFKHVAVQVEPEEDRFPEPDRARRLLELYFGEASTRVFWGGVEDFTRELQTCFTTPSERVGT